MRQGTYIRILLPALMLYALGMLFGAGAKLELAQEEKQNAQQLVQRLEEENQVLRYEIAHSDDPELIARQARQRLGLVMPEDRLIYDLGN